MTLNDRTISELLEYKFNLDFINLTLTQKNTEDPLTYSGPGSIYQEDDGVLHLKLYHSFVDTGKELFGKTGERIPGKIMGEEHFFQLTGIDMKGRTWEARKLHVVESLSSPAAGKVITTTITELQKVERRQEGVNTNKSHLIMLVKGKFSVPPNDYEDREGYRTLNTFKMLTSAFSLQLISREGYLLINIGSDNGFLKEATKPILLEALSIVFGKLITPVYTGFGIDDLMITNLMSTPTSVPNRVISEPIPHYAPHHVEAVTEFIEKYLLRISEPYGDLFGFWHKINRAWQGGIENAALAVTVAIEGIVKAYLYQYGLPDEDFIKQADDALEPIKLLPIGARIKERLISSLGSTKSSNPKSALLKLADHGVYNKKLVSDWIALRNMSAHADKFGALNNDQFQKYIDRVFKCQLLFYCLCFTVLEYTNLHYDFSERGWPEKSFSG